MFYDPRRDGITQSILVGFLKCREMAKLSAEGWVSRRPSSALQFGELVHGVLEDIYTVHKKKPFKKAPSLNEILLVLNKRIDSFKEENTRMDKRELEQLELNAALAEALLPEYFKFWFKEDFQKTKWVALEQEFRMELTDIPGTDQPIIFRGKRDGVFEEAKELALFETKTKSRIEEESLDDLLAFDFQTDAYSMSCLSEFGRYPKFTRYNILRRPGQKLGKIETLAQFTLRVSKAIQEDPEHYFIRYRISKSTKEQEEFYKNFKIIVKEFLDWWDKQLPTYKNYSACVSRYGACHYLKICSNQNYLPFYKREKIFPELEAQGGKK